jgi:glycosyltransferase involved in cell wall biosynthesis
LYLGGNFLKENMIFKTFKVSNNIDQQIINSKNIINLGHITNLNRFYQRIDILCFPSYLNALGRQVFEAGLFRYTKYSMPK